MTGQTTPPTHRILVVFNPNSGQGESGLPEFVTFLRDSGASVTERELQPDVPMSEYVQDLTEYSAVVGAGGDGTVSSLAYAARYRDVPLLAYPAGTANLIAQNLDLPRDPAALAEVVDRGPTDLLRDGPLAQLSTVWENEEQRQQSWTELHRTTDDLLRALDVEDSTVNLLADDAELRATVANSSTTSFHDLRVVVRPGNDRVTADQPEGSLGLGARGRASTSFTARTHAAGQVPVRILVTTPDGGRVLARGEVTVNARPATGGQSTKETP